MKIFDYKCNTVPNTEYFSINPKEAVFFDIETTGFSALSGTIYLIGAVYFENEEYRLTQWFADSPASEADIIKAFFERIGNFKYLIHFNGDSFDIPFIAKRCQKLYIKPIFENILSIDIYKRIQHYRKMLCLGSTRQKSIEIFLGISREDEFDGGKLINVYKEYLHDNSEEKLNLLLLHNHDDMLGMLSILDIFKFEAIKNHSESEVFIEKYDETSVLITAVFPENFPAPFSHRGDWFYMVCSANKLKVKINLFKGELKHFFANYRDYFYLPLEDMAVHKSVAIYVDKEHKQKATKENCFVKKSGTFLPVFDTLGYDAFGTSYGNDSYIELKEAFMDNKDFAKAYFDSIIEYL